MTDRKDNSTKRCRNTHTHTHTQTHTHTHTNTHTHKHTHTNTHAHTHTNNTHTRARAHTHTHIYTHLDTYRHLRAGELKSKFSKRGFQGTLEGTDRGCVTDRSGELFSLLLELDKRKSADHLTNMNANNLFS